YLEDGKGEYKLVGRYLDVLEDSRNALDINYVSSPSFNFNFHPNPFEIFRIYKTNSTYWFRLTLKNKSEKVDHWVLEIFDSHIDTLEIYIPFEKGKFKKFQTGDQENFNSREYKHKNFAFGIALKKEEEKTIYIKVKSSHPVAMMGVVRSPQRFVHYSTSEYFLLALFYGLLISMAAYNLFLFITVKDVAYFFYVLYSLSFGLYSISLDGTGYHFLWSNSPYINNYIRDFALLFISINGLLYTRYFLTTYKIIPSIDVVIWVVILLRFLVFIAGFTFVPELRTLPYLDIVPLFLAFLSGIFCLVKGYMPARFFILGFTLLFSGFFINTLESTNLVNSNIFTVYSINFGIVSDMFLLSFALADRIKNLVKQKEKAHAETIQHLKESEKLKEKIQSELEEIVQHRTNELKEKNKQLDLFVYKASHDIRTPLSSIIESANKSLASTTDEVARHYLEHILKSTARLDLILGDMLSLSQMKGAQLSISKIDFEEILKEILDSLQHTPNFKHMQFNIEVDNTVAFYSDKKVLYSVLQNLTENAIKYSDPGKDNPYLKITIKQTNEKALLQFEDNGLGIGKEHHSKIFDMFYKVNENSNGTGLGLYLVKMTIEKLGGTISIDGEAGKGTVFSIELKNMTESVPA
ncbi:MAG TPA: sensor histidine kinase, partial [Cytophagaceae bacterium]